MHFSPDQAAILMTRVNNALAGDAPDASKLQIIWNEMTVFRAQVLSMTMRHYLGDAVYSGPFKGMRLTAEVIEGVSAPALLGVYEHELHPVIEHMVAHPFRHVLNIGCSYGYYSVGFALRLPQATIHAFDIDAEARAKCRVMVELNQVQDRVSIGGEFRGEDFAAYADQETLVVMDIEGAELGLLNPDLYPALRKMAIIVELHDLFDASISPAIQQRFAPTHNIQIIRNKVILADINMDSAKIDYVDPFDQLLLTWERRTGPTPWAVMLPKSN